MTTSEYHKTNSMYLTQRLVIRTEIQIQCEKKKSFGENGFASKWKDPGTSRWKKGAPRKAKRTQHGRSEVHAVYFTIESQVTWAFGSRVGRNTAIALGSWVNLPHAKALSCLLMKEPWHGASEGERARLEVDLKGEGGRAVLFTTERTWKTREVFSCQTKLTQQF